MDIDTTPSDSNGKYGIALANSFIFPQKQKQISQPKTKTRYTESKQDRLVRKEFEREGRAKIRLRDYKETQPKTYSKTTAVKPKTHFNISKLLKGLKSKVVSKPILKNTKVVVDVPSSKYYGYKSVFFNPVYEEVTSPFKNDKNIFWS